MSSPTRPSSREAGVDPASLRTFDDFDKALAKIKATLPADEPVIMLGNKEQYPALHLWGMIQGAYVPAQEVRDWIFHREGKTFDTPGNRTALAKLKEWQDKGYLGQADDYNGRAELDAVTLVRQGPRGLPDRRQLERAADLRRPRRGRVVLRHAARRGRQARRDRLGQRADPRLGQDEEP